MHTNTFSDPANARLNAYQQVGVQTSSPQELVLMLFDGLERTLGVASQAGVAEPTRDAAMMKANAIFAELESSLDLDRGGELAANLFALYDYLTRQLRDAKGAERPAIAARVRTLIAPVADAWRSICAQNPEAPRMVAEV